MSMLDHIGGLWRRRKWIAILAFAAPASMVVGMVTSLPNIYRSTATLLVERQQVPEAFVRTTVTGELETRLQTISQQILSRSRLESLITRFDLYARLRGRLSPEEVVARMRKDVTMVMKSDDRTNSGGGKTVAFTISYRGADPVTVAQVANTLASFYVEEDLKVRARQATGTAEFLRVQLEETKKQLDIQERRVSEYNRRHLGELPQQMASNLAALEQFGAQLRLNGDRQTLSLARREALERQRADGEATFTRVGTSPGAGAAPDSAMTRLARLRLELTELRTQYTEKYPEVSRVKNEIAALERQQREKESDAEPEVPAPPPPDPGMRRIKEALSEIDAELKALKNDERRLQATMSRYQTRVENTPQREQEFQELSRDYQTTKDHYQTLLKRYQEAQLAEEMEQRQKGEQFRIMDPAIASARSAAPDRPRLLVMGFVLSLGLAVGAVLLAEQMNPSLHGLDDLRTFTRVPVLVSIPTIVTPADLLTRRRRVVLSFALVVVAVTVLGGGSHLLGRGNEWLVWLLSQGGV